MKTKFALALVLAAVSGAALAEWVNLGENEKATIYADPTTIRRSGDMVKVWTMYDLKSPEPISGRDPTRSLKEQREYDCKEERSRALYVTVHGKEMGRGKLIGTVDEPAKWEPVVPDSFVQDLWKFACGKK